MLDVSRLGPSLGRDDERPEHGPECGTSEPRPVRPENPAPAAGPSDPPGNAR